MSKYLDDRVIDSDYDWFWLTTNVELGKIFKLRAETVEKELQAMATADIETVGDYLQLVMGYCRSKGVS
ncbi:MAG TPA: hypothetical protein PK671_18390 [Candidatus Obscuribacter sp.]|nr:hypothetical protein [Candidatus Obscuribacter sp.]